MQKSFNQHLIQPWVAMAVVSFIRCHSPPALQKLTSDHRLDPAALVDLEVGFLFITNVEILLGFNLKPKIFG